MDVRKLAQFIYEATGEARFKADGTYWLDWNELLDDKQIEWIAVARLVIEKMVDNDNQTPLPELLGFLDDTTVEALQIELDLAYEEVKDLSGTRLELLERVVREHREMLKEIADYGTILDHCSQIYMHVTNGMISKPFTLPEVVKAIHDDITTEEFKQWMEDELEYCTVLDADETEALWRFLYAQGYWHDEVLDRAVAKLKKVSDQIARDSVQDNG